MKCFQTKIALLYEYIFYIFFSKMNAKTPFQTQRIVLPKNKENRKQKDEILVKIIIPFYKETLKDWEKLPNHNIEGSEFLKPEGLNISSYEQAYPPLKRCRLSPTG